MDNQRFNQRFLQTNFWADFKAAHGWKKYLFEIKDNSVLSVYKNEQDNTKNTSNKSNTVDFCANNDSNILQLSVLVREFSIKIKKISLAYIPMAPEFLGFDWEKDKKNYWEQISNLTKLIKPYLPKNTAFVRFDPPLDFKTIEEREQCKKDASSLFLAQKKSFRPKKSFVDVQPPDTVLLPLEKSEDEILSSMKSKWRYNIRLSAKKGVEVKKYRFSDEHFSEAFEDFYRLFEQTSERDKVSFHGKDYYYDLLKRGDSENPSVNLYLAYHEGEALAGIITLFCEREAVYLYGASGNVKRNLMPAYLLQWTAIQDAKKYGCPVYDFYGIPPTDDENHPMHGLYLFKTGFGGTIVHRPGSFDVGFNFFYKLYSSAEQCRAWWHKKFLKQFKKKN